MSREEVAALLAAHVVAGHLTRDEARVLLEAWDQGEITDADLPEPPASLALTASLAAAGIGGAVALLLAALRRQQPRYAQRAARAADRAQVAPEVILNALPADRRRQLAEGLLETFGREADRRTGLLFAAPDEAAADRRSRGDLRRWQVAMRQAIGEDVPALARLGAGRALTAAEQAALARTVAEQVAYVDGFAARLATDRAGLTPPLSERQVASALRRTLGGVERAAFYRAYSGSFDAGWVLRFRGFDGVAGRRSSCTPCLSAERGGPLGDGTYLPGQAPIPSEVCRGGGHCKHQLVPAEDAAAYARLTPAVNTRQAA